MSLLEKLYQTAEGRLLLISELQRFLAANDECAAVDRLQVQKLVQAGIRANRIVQVPGIAEAMEVSKSGLMYRKTVKCSRCGSGKEAIRWSFCAKCKRNCPYCEACLQMGKIRGCSVLVHGISADEATVRVTNKSRTDAGRRTQTAGRFMEQTERGEQHVPAVLQKVWGLSKAQADAASEALQFIHRDDPGGLFLIWAVTGAGKTEMMFPLIDSTIRRGGRVCIATPRKDVVIELAPRLSERFPALSMAVLYGGSDPTWNSPSLTLATTHQLLRFKRAFDLVVIDEVDAFPYHNDRMLNEAAERAVRLSGKRLFLSATPPEPLRKRAAKGKLPHVKVPCRFHGHPLPVPVLIQSSSQKRRWNKLVKQLDASLARGAQLFLFVPKIGLTEPIVQSLRNVFPDVTIEGTSSVDPDRAEKVERFRKRDIRLLVTTTILERGVTVARSDVFVYDADASLFDDAALVQMAGRAGRKLEDPSGRVYFVAKARARSITQAINQIQLMNREAKRRGFLR